MEGPGNPVLYQGLVVFHKVFAQGHSGQPSQFQDLFLVMRLRIWAGPAPAEIIGKWVGEDLVAPRLKPSPSGYEPGPVGKAVQRQQSQGRVPGVTGEVGRAGGDSHQLFGDQAIYQMACI